MCWITVKNIKDNKDIIAIKINEYIISQYAEDIIIILDGSEKSLNATII